MSRFKITAFYKFVPVSDPESLREALLARCKDDGVKGTIIVAEEGINGTIAAEEDVMDELWKYLQALPDIGGLNYKASYSEKMPFLRMKVKVKPEIVSSGVDSLNPNEVVGEYVKPENWNTLISDPDVIVIDTRNEFEYEIGSFKGAVNPETFAFREFPQFVDNNLDPHKHKKVAMFCTGGIRCEKASALMLQKGFENVYHLQGGILQYLEDVPQEKSMWEGECFVFDDRITVDHNLEQGSYQQCFACKHPLTEEELKSEYYEQGVSCLYCHDKLSPEKKARVAERQKQVELAKARNTTHLGS